MLQRLWRLLFPVHTGQVQSWWEYLRSGVLEANDWKPCEELLQWQAEIPERRRIEQCKQDDSLRRQRAADAVRAKFGGEA